MTSGFHLAVLLCLASGLLTVEACDADQETSPCCPVCPPGWTHFGARCFYYQHKEKKWADAERECLAKGGNLASIHTEKEHDFVKEYMNRVSNANKHTWLGGHDAVEEGFWMWTDGTKLVYTRWSSSEPNNLKRKEHCLEMNFQEDFWNDKPCATKRPFLCSKDLPCPAPSCNKH